MLISAAYAASDVAAAAPGNAIVTQLLMVLVLVAMFYILLIRPQQRRFKEHAAMLKQMKKGDKVLTAAGFIGTVDHVVEGKDEIVIDLGHGVKVTALLSSIQTRIDHTDSKDTKDSKAA